LIAEAAEVILLVSGREKAEAVARVLEGPRDPDALPAQGVALRDGVVRWLLDAPAAAGLAAPGRPS
jgi:6-phosphogluconolactonase